MKFHCRKCKRTFRVSINDLHFVMKLAGRFRACVDWLCLDCTVGRISSSPLEEKVKSMRLSFME